MKQPNKLNLNEFHQMTRKKNKSVFQTIKKQVRDLKRLIEKGNIPEEVKAAKQKELEEKEKELYGKNREKKVKEKQIAYFSKKYDRIRTVERKKLARKIRQINTQLAEDTFNDQEKQDAIAEKKDLLVKLKYVKTFPKDQKYISVFNENVEHAAQKKTELLTKISEKTENFRTKKFTFVTDNGTETKRQRKKDDFFTSENTEAVTKKKFVNKQGKTVG